MATAEHEVHAAESLDEDKVRSAEPREAAKTCLSLAAATLGTGCVVLFLYWPLGIIFILLGVAIPIAAVKIGALTGPCPYCGHKTTVLASKDDVICDACQRRIRIRDGDFARWD